MDRSPLNWHLLRRSALGLGCLTFVVIGLFPNVLWAAAEGGTASDTSTVLLMFVYCVLIFGSSLLGGWLPSLFRLTHTRLQLLISLIGGLMIGVGLLHQLPHAYAVAAQAGLAGPLDWAVKWMLGGLVVMFFMLRTFHFHHHEPVQPPPSLAPATPVPVVSELPVVSSAVHHEQDHDHGDGCGHDHDHDHGGHHHHHHHEHLPPKSTGGWIGIALGLALHSLLDGMALGAHVEADHQHGGLTFLGLATFLGIFLHKPLDSLSITSLMAASGWSSASRHAVNAGYALMCPAGAVLFMLGVQSLGGHAAAVISAALAFSAGIFLCIALSDLLPEVEFHSHDKGKLSAAFLLGIAMAWGIGFLEPEHAHGPSSAHDTHSHDHDHGHSH